MAVNKIHVWFPMILMTAVIAATCYLTYGMPKGPWYQVVYLDKTASAVLRSSAFADAIVAGNKNAATVYIQDKDNAALERSGAIIIDPKGVPLCLTSPY